MRLRIRAVEVFTPEGNFLVSRINTQLICQKQLPGGLRVIDTYNELPRIAVLPVMGAVNSLSPNFFVPEHDPVKRGFRIGGLNRCTDCAGQHA